MNDKLDWLWLRQIIDICDYQFGVHESSTDYGAQRKEWKCWGCSGVGYTEWPRWGKPDFKHDADCKWLVLDAILNQQ